jgi:hypothetical protein
VRPFDRGQRSLARHSPLVTVTIMATATTATTAGSPQSPKLGLQDRHPLPFWLSPWSPAWSPYLQMMPGGRLSIVIVTVEPGSTLVPALGLWSITCPGSRHCAVCAIRAASPAAASALVAWALVSPTRSRTVTAPSEKGSRSRPGARWEPRAASPGASSRPRAPASGPAGSSPAGHRPTAASQFPEFRDTARSSRASRSSSFARDDTIKEIAHDLRVTGRSVWR